MDNIIDSKYFSSIIYVFIWVSLWGIIETFVELTRVGMLGKIIIYFLLLFASSYIYMFVLHKEIDLKALREKQKKPVQTLL